MSRFLRYRVYAAGYDKIIWRLVKSLFDTLLNFKKTLFIDLAISAIMLGALAIGLVFFTLKINGAVTSIATLRQDIVNRSASLNAFSSLHNQYLDQAQSYLNVLYNVVPTKDQLIDLPKEIQSLAVQQNLGFGFSFAGETMPTGPGTLGSVAFKSSVTGNSLNSLLAFVQALGNFYYLSNIDSISFNYSNNYQMIIAGRVFYR